MLLMKERISVYIEKSPVEAGLFVVASQLQY
jgi:hypothetical protein